ncbi:MAG: putative DNA binding domain-containing protein [Thermodesulfobacteriota bacterium]|nr:putative DNA binding domain-containing protein [Thermodesulfobacteriota bacterium]
MNREELIKRIGGYEWNDVEFKSAQRGVPDDAYKTVSAFSNTSGGWLVFGVKEASGIYEIIGVIEVDKVQNDFLSALRSGGKFNRVIYPRENMVQEDDNTLLVFYIPEVRRQDKPIFLSGDIRKSFIRRGGGDERCTEDEIKRFIRDAADVRYDCEPVDLDPEHCFDAETVSWYRAVFKEHNSAYDESQSDIEFLHHWALVVEKGGELLPTRAALLLFGSGPVVRQILPRPVVDCQWINTDFSDSLPIERWADRLVCEDNIVRTWRNIVERFVHHAEKPFRIDPEMLHRQDHPPDYIAFRESMINILIHQDYAEHSKKPAVKFFRDRTILWNPGDSFASRNELLEPGEKEVRNPLIVSAFRRIRLSEQAGTGFRTIFRNWQELGRVPPIIDNDKGNKTFALTLLKEPLLSEEQLLFQASLGVRLSDPEAKTFAYICRQKNINLIDVKVVTNLSSAEAQAILVKLSTQALITPASSSSSTHYLLAKHLRERFGKAVSGTDQAEALPARLVSDQVQPRVTKLVTDQPVILKNLNDTQWKILAFCEAPRPMVDIMSHLQLTHRAFFRRKHLEPLIKGGVISMMHPDQPNHPGQAYVITEVGAKLLGGRIEVKNNSDGEGING